MVSAQGVKFDGFVIPAPQGRFLGWGTGYSPYRYKFYNIRAGICSMLILKRDVVFRMVCLSWDCPRIVWDDPLLIPLLWTAFFRKGVVTRIWNGEMTVLNPVLQFQW